MGNIVLARVDERLIHGQVMTQLSKSSGANMIIVVDDEVANDPFMKKIFLSTGKRTGLKIKILTREAAIEYWKEDQFGNYSVILLAKTVETFHILVNSGMVLKALNIGAISNKENTTSIIKSVSINVSQLDLLNKMKEEQKIDVYFQAIPSSEKVSLNDANSKF